LKYNSLSITFLFSSSLCTNRKGDIDDDDGPTRLLGRGKLAAPGVAMATDRNSGPLLDDEDE
jgi:hypothetical protein